MRRFQSSDELAGLLVVSVSGERDIVHRHLQWKFLAGHGGNFLWFRHDMLHMRRRQVNCAHTFHLSANENI